MRRLILCSLSRLPDFERIVVCRLILHVQVGEGSVRLGDLRDPAPQKLLLRMHWQWDTLSTPLHRNVFEQRFESQISIGAEDGLRAGRTQEGQRENLLGMGSIDAIPADDVV